MDAIKMLKKQHREVEALFKELQKAKSAGPRRKVFEKVADALAVHATIEERHFYPAAKKKQTQDMLLEAAEEHLAVKRVIADLLELDASDPVFMAKVTVLKEEVQHHVEEEEEELFPEGPEAPGRRRARGPCRVDAADRRRAAKRGGAADVGSVGDARSCAHLSGTHVSVDHAAVGQGARRRVFIWGRRARCYQERHLGVTVRDGILLPDRIIRWRNVAIRGPVVVARRLLKRGVEVTRTMANRMSTAEARKDFANLLRSSAAGERIKLTRYNKTVAVLISKRDLDELEDCQRRHREVAQGARRAYQDPVAHREARQAPVVTTSARAPRACFADPVAWRWRSLIQGPKLARREARQRNQRRQRPPVSDDHDRLTTVAHDVQNRGEISSHAGRVHHFHARPRLGGARRSRQGNIPSTACRSVTAQTSRRRGERCALYLSRRSPSRRRLRRARIFEG